MSVDGLAPWQARTYARAAEALAADRLGHALLFVGPTGLGLREVVEHLARRVLCGAPAHDGAPCGACHACRLFDARHQRDPEELRPDGRLAHPHGHPGHPDAHFIGHAIHDKTGKPRSEIVIEQIRRLCEQLGLTPQYGRAQVALIDPAEALNVAAANALLKTLEEPQPGRYLWLIASEDARLPATIRSRCQRIVLGMPPREEALHWLQQRGHGEIAAAEALTAANGHPGLADHWLQGEGLGVRRQVAGDLEALRQGRQSALDLAKRWTDDGQADARLRFAADIALEQARDGVDARRARGLAHWFQQANRTRDLLRTTVRADLAIAQLLLDWATEQGVRRR